jgi:hypothetical protein
VYFTSLTNAIVFVGQKADVSNYWYIWKDTNANGNKLGLNFVYGGSNKATYDMTSAWSGVSISTWYHITFVRTTTAAKIFINGVSQTLTATTAFGTNDVGNISGKLKIGAWGLDGAESSFLTGYIDELRISKGTASWTTNFSVPNIPYRYGQVDFNLGSITLGPNCKISDIEVIDARSRGGGLSNRGIAELEQVKFTQPESQFFWDTGYFDGQAVPADGVLVVKVPKTLLKSNGGSFGAEDIRNRCYRHVAMGTFLILEYV